VRRKKSYLVVPVPGYLIIYHIASPFLLTMTKADCARLERVVLFLKQKRHPSLRSAIDKEASSLLNDGTVIDMFFGLVKAS